jgi:hypothetical protein
MRIRNIPHVTYFLIGAIAGALLGFPFTDFIKPIIGEMLLLIFHFAISIYGIFLEVEWLASFLFGIYDFLFEDRNSLPPVIFYMILIPYEILWTYYYLRWAKKKAAELISG